MIFKTVASFCVVMLMIHLIAPAQDAVGISDLQEAGTMLKIKIAGVFVDNQEKAAKFYTELLGFVIKTDIPAGEFRWAVNQH